VRGLIAILFALYSGKPARDILSVDALGLFDQLGLRENLTPQRSNGLRSMVERIALRPMPRWRPFTRAWTHKTAGRTACQSQLCPDSRRIAA